MKNYGKAVCIDLMYISCHKVMPIGPRWLMQVHSHGCICVRVCVYEYMYAFMCVCVCMHLCIYVCLYVSKNINISLHLVSPHFILFPRFNALFFSLQIWQGSTKKEFILIIRYLQEQCSAGRGCRRWGGRRRVSISSRLVYTLVS